MVLSKEEIKKWIPILQAFVDGKQLEKHNGKCKTISDGDIVDGKFIMNGGLNIEMDENGWSAYTNEHYLELQVKFGDITIQDPNKIYRIHE